MLSRALVATASLLFEQPRNGVLSSIIFIRRPDGLPILLTTTVGSGEPQMPSSSDKSHDDCPNTELLLLQLGTSFSEVSTINGHKLYFLGVLQHI